MSAPVPNPVIVAVELAADALAEWNACPPDSDHQDRHAKADAFAARRRDVDREVTRWLNDLAETRTRA